MDTQKGVSAIIYDKRGDDFFFLIIRRSNEEVWEFPKGRMNDEDPMEAVKEEIRKETGLTKFKVKGTLVKDRVIENSGKKYSFKTFLVEANMNVVVSLSQTHDNYLWAKKNRVREKLYWPQEKDFFEEAITVLKNT